VLRSYQFLLILYLGKFLRRRCLNQWVVRYEWEYFRWWVEELLSAVPNRLAESNRDGIIFIFV
jgi:hypothetical protein